MAGPHKCGVFTTTTATNGSEGSQHLQPERTNPRAPLALARGRPGLAWLGPGVARARPPGLGPARPDPKTIANTVFFKAFKTKRLKNLCFMKPPGFRVLVSLSSLVRLNNEKKLMNF